MGCGDGTGTGKEETENGDWGAAASYRNKRTVRACLPIYQLFFPRSKVRHDQTKSRRKVTLGKGNRKSAEGTGTYLWYNTVLPAES